jgi:hypothetical protein
MPMIVAPDVLLSAPFVVLPGRHVVLQATGMQAGDLAVVELVQLSVAPVASGNPCCYQDVPPTAVLAATPLRCPNGARTLLSAAVPYVVLTGPHMLTMRVRVIPADPSAEIAVHLHDYPAALNPLCAPCCAEPFSASYPLAGGGFGFVDGDMRDPEATVEVQPCNGSGPTVFIFPTPRPGATAPVTDCAGNVAGYAPNTSLTPITIGATPPCPEDGGGLVVSPT